MIYSEPPPIKSIMNASVHVMLMRDALECVSHTEATCPGRTRRVAVLGKSPMKVPLVEPRSSRNKAASRSSITACCLLHARESRLMSHSSLALCVIVRKCV